MEQENQDNQSEISPQKQPGVVKTALPFLIIIILAAAGVFVYFNFFSNSEQNGAEEVQQGTQQQLEEPNYTIEEVSIDIADIAPSLERNIQFGESIPENVRAMLETQAVDLRNSLAEDVRRADAWFNLGIVYHTANDYEGAKEIWEFLIQVIPNSTTAYDNLAKLYHFSIPNFSKSEEYFNQSLSVDPENINAYLGLFELYRFSYKTETGAAEDVMNRTIAQFPERLDLPLTLGVYYRERGDFTKAREVLTEGLDKARDAGDVSMITAFGEEIGRLPAN